MSGTPSIADVHTAQGWRLYRANRFARAATMFDIALAAEPADYSALVGRGRCNRLLRRYDEALADFTQAHTLRPEAARPLIERGAISVLIGRYEDSRSDYEAAASLEPTYPGLASYFAELYLYTGRAAEALAVSDRASREEPTNLVHRVNIAHAHLLLGDVERAAQAYGAVAALYDPGKGVAAASIALDDLTLLRSAGIEPPGMARVEQDLRDSLPARS